MIEETQRYSMEQSSGDGWNPDFHDGQSAPIEPAEMVESDSGDWCKWSDVEPLLATIAEQIKRIEELEDLLQGQSRQLEYQEKRFRQATHCECGKPLDVLPCECQPASF